MAEMLLCLIGLTESKVDETRRKARQDETLILELRNNGGGYQVALKRLVGRRVKSWRPGATPC